MNVLNVLCAQLTRDLFAIAKFLLTLDPTQPDPSKTDNFVTQPVPTRRMDGPDLCPTLRRVGLPV